MDRRERVGSLRSLVCCNIKYNVGRDYGKKEAVFFKWCFVFLCPSDQPALSANELSDQFQATPYRYERCSCPIQARFESHD